MRRSIHSIVGGVSLALAGAQAGAAQNDFQLPTDFVALKDGAVNVAAYAVRQTLDGPWRDGVKRMGGEVSTDIFALRVTRHYSVGDGGKYTIAPIMVLGVGDVDTNVPALAATGRHASGFSDLRLGSSFWFHVDRANREFGMATLLFTLPTGDYKQDQALNVSENRWKAVLSLGWMQQLGRGWVLELAPEVAFYGDNDRYMSTRRLSQDAAYAVTGTLRYRFTPDVHGYVTAQINRGGATQVNGRPAMDGPENTRLAAGMLLFAGGGHQLQLRYARDTGIQNGFRNDGELVLRWSRVFE